MEHSAPCKYEDYRLLSWHSPISATFILQFCKLSWVSDWHAFFTHLQVFFPSSWNRISCIWLWAFWVCKDALYLVPAVNNVYTVYDILLLCLIPKSTSPSTFAPSAFNLKNISRRNEGNFVTYVIKGSWNFFCILQILCMKMMKLNLPEKKPLIAIPLSEPWTPFCPTVQCTHPFCVLLIFPNTCVSSHTRVYSEAEVLSVYVVYKNTMQKKMWAVSRNGDLWSIRK